MMPPALIHSGSKFLALMLDSALRSLLLACFLAMVLAMLRVRAVRAKLLVWRGMLLVGLAMPLLMLLSPAIPLAVPVPTFYRATPAPTADGSQREAISAIEPSRAIGSDEIGNTRDSVAPSVTVAPVRSFAVSGGAHTAFPWILVACAFYFAVAGYFLARLRLGMYFGARLARGATPVTDAEAQRPLMAATREAGLRNAPWLAESGALRVPVTLGILRPAILLPRDWRDWDCHQLLSVLAHEVSHVARRDSFVQLFALLHRAVFWFSPLSWWMDRHLAGLAEQASDEAALAAGADRTRYAETLLDFLAHLETSPARVRWHGVAMAKMGQGEKRLERILSWRPDMTGNVKKSLIVALAAVCLPAVALTASLHPSAYARQNAAIPAPPAPPPPAQALPNSNSFSAPIAAPGASANAAPGEPPQIASPLSGAALPTQPLAPEAEAVPLPQTSQPAAPPARAPSQGPAPAAPPVAVPDVPPPGAWGAANDYEHQYGPIWPWGPRFVIVTGGSDNMIVHGTEEDAELAREMRSKIHGDFIWFEHDGKSYVIRDKSIVEQAKKIWAQSGDSAKLRQELQQKEQALQNEMHVQVQQKMQEIRVKVPDMSAELQKLQSEIKDFNASGATMQQLGDLQRQLGELQRTLGQAQWNSNMQEITRKAGELGAEMGALGTQIGDLARQEIDQSQQAGQQMRQLFDNAIASGAAKLQYSR